MKKTFRNYIGIWAALLVLFNVIAFVSVGWAGQEKYTASFWIGYGFITAAFVGQLLCAKAAFKEDSMQKAFYNIPLIRISYTGLACSFVFGGTCMLISPLPYWVGVILCAIVLTICVISALKAATAADLVARVDEKVKTQTAFIRLLTVDTENLLSRAKTETAKVACKKVYEAVRYSDPMSNNELISIESEISARMAVLTEATAANNEETITDTAKEIVTLIGERNQKCKMLK